MSFDIQIRVDPNGAPATIDAVTNKLRQAETQALKMNVATAGLSSSFKSLAAALASETSAYDRLVSSQNEQIASTTAAARASQTWQAALLREREMLEQIHGPSQKLAQDTQTLQALMQRGAISASEYSGALAKAKQAAGSGGGGMLSGLGSQLGGLGGLGGLGMAAGAIYGTKELADIDDKYTELRNSALRFADADHNVNQVLGDQRELARSLHQDLGQSMEAYERVRESLDDVNLSYDQGLRLTKTYTEAAVLNGRSTEDLAQQMQNLKVAFDTGTDASRPMKAIFKEFPDLAKQWEHSLGLTEKQILQMGKSGKLSFEQLLNASITATDGIDAKFGQRAKTWKQTWDEFKDDVERPLDIEATMAQLVNQMQPFENTLDRLKKKFADFRTTVGGAAADATISDFGGLSKALSKVAEGAGAVVTNYDELAKHIGIVDPWKVAADKHAQALSSEDELLKSIRQPMTTANALIKDSADLYAKGAITVQQWAEQVRKAQELAGTEPPVRSVVSGEGGDFFTPFRDQPGTGGIAAPDLNEVPSSALDHAMNQNADPDKSGLFGVRADYTDEQKKTQAAYDAILKPQKDFADGQTALNELLAMGKIDAATYTDQLDKLRTTYDSTLKHSTDFATGLHHGWDSIVKEATDSAGHIETAMTGALGVVETSLEDLVMKGKFDLSSLGSALEAILVKLAVQQATGSLIGAIGGGRTGFDYMTPSGPGPALPGFATGGDMLVGGAGAPDSKLAMFRVSPGESIHVRTPEQRAAAASTGGSGGPSHTIVNLNYDPRAIQSGKAIETGVMNAIKGNRAAVRALLGI